MTIFWNGAYLKIAHEERNRMKFFYKLSESIEIEL